MRVFSYILVIIVLVLNLVPCADAHGADENINTYCAQDSSAKNTGADACTPFCHCSCCAASTTIKVISLISAPIQSFKNPALYYLEDNHSTISHPIWQPPKFG